MVPKNWGAPRCDDAMIPSIRIDVKNSMLLKEKGHLGNSGKEREGEGKRGARREAVGNSKAL